MYEETIEELSGFPGLPVDDSVANLNQAFAFFTDEVGRTFRVREIIFLVLTTCSFGKTFSQIRPRREFYAELVV